jgi:hypothetical protein
VVVGNVLLGNGDPGSFFGGFSASTQVTGNRFDFNTLNNNQTTNSQASGVQCLANNFTAQYNIIWNNMSNTGQLSGNCMYAYSDIGPITDVVPGAGNMKDDPVLLANGHLQATSGAVLMKATNADLTGLAARDIDGDLRIAPADLGADQLSH